MFIEIGLFTSLVYYLVLWNASAVSLPQGDAIFDQLACSLEHFYKHCP